MLFFCPLTILLLTAALLHLGTYPASGCKLVVSAEAAVFPHNVLHPLGSRTEAGTRLKSGQSESSPRYFYKLGLGKESFFFPSWGLDFYKTQELLVAMIPLLNCIERIKLMCEDKRDWNSGEFQRRLKYLPLVVPGPQLYLCPSRVLVIKPVVLNWGPFCPREYWALSGDILGCHNEGTATGI